MNSHRKANSDVQVMTFIPFDCTIYLHVSYQNDHH